MSRVLTATLAVVVVVAAVGVAPAAGLAPATDASRAAPQPAPGAQLAGVVGVGRAELEGEVRARAVTIAVARAPTDDAKAAVVAGQLARADGRLDALEARKAALDAARENGSLGESAYRARVATLAAEVGATQHVLNRSSDAADGLPEEALAANGVNATAIESLRTRASDLGGGEVAELARSVAGPGAGSTLGGPTDPGTSNRPDHAADRGNRPAGNATTTEAADGSGG